MPNQPVRTEPASDPAGAAQAAAPLDDFICFAVYSTHNALMRFYRPLLEPLGLTYLQYLVLQLLWAGEGRSVKAIGEVLRLESNTLTPVLKRLEAEGLVSRRRDDADERVVRIDLTEAGRAMQAEAAHVPQRLLEAVGLSQAEFAALNRTLYGIRNRLLDE